MTRTQRTTRRAFTLTEILVVIVLIILMLGLAVPAFNLIRGSRSVEGAENQVNALIGRARTDAIGLQKHFGVIFFVDPTSWGNSPVDGRVAAAEVMEVDFPTAGNPTREIYLDRVADTEYVYLPSGVLAMTLNHGINTAIPGDRYLGYNTVISQNGTTVAGGSSVYIGGLILFDGNGQLVSRSWGYVTFQADPQNAGQGLPTEIAKTLGLPMGTKTAPFADPGPTPPAGIGGPMSALGFVLCDAPTFKNNGSIDDPQLTGANYGTSGEAGEESWIDENSTPILINRYNGTLDSGAIV